LRIFSASPQTCASISTDFRFTTGSPNADSGMMVRAIEVCRELLQSATLAGPSPHILDIGGGFPVDYLKPAMPIEEFCAADQSGAR